MKIGRRGFIKAAVATAAVSKAAVPEIAKQPEFYRPKPGGEIYHYEVYYEASDGTYRKVPDATLSAWTTPLSPRPRRPLRRP